MVHNLSVRQISLALAVRLHVLQLLDCALEFRSSYPSHASTRLSVIPKYKLALLKGFGLVLVIFGVLKLSFHLNILLTRSVMFLTDCPFV